MPAIETSQAEIIADTVYSGCCLSSKTNELHIYGFERNFSTTAWWITMKQRFFFACVWINLPQHHAPPPKKKNQYQLGDQITCKSKQKLATVQSVSVICLLKAY